VFIIIDPLPPTGKFLKEQLCLVAYFYTRATQYFQIRLRHYKDKDQFATRLIKYAADAGSVFTEQALITAFLDGILPFAGNIIRGHVTKGMKFTDVRIMT
jgi:hypothetical protein